MSLNETQQALANSWAGMKKDTPSAHTQIIQRENLNCNDNINNNNINNNNII